MINLNRSVIGLLTAQGLISIFVIDQATLGGWSLVGATVLTAMELNSNE